jgi:hypothetical protein
MFAVEQTPRAAHEILHRRNLRMQADDAGATPSVPEAGLAAANDVR